MFSLGGWLPVAILSLSTFNWLNIQDVEERKLQFAIGKQNGKLPTCSSVPLMQRFYQGNGGAL